MSRAAWFLNLDAEEELAGDDRWARRSGLWAATAAHRQAAASVLLGPEDVIVEPGAELAGPWLGRAWCATPNALEVLRAAGARVEAAPTLQVLRHVNHRAFLVDAGFALPGTGWLQDEGDWRALSSEAPAGSWRLKRAFGAAGRGQRVLRPGSCSPSDGDWVRGSLSRGPLLVEPELERLAEFTTHGWVGQGGQVRVGRPLVQEVDARGAWAGTGQSCPIELVDPLRSAALEVGRALAEAGYFGPFGLDAIEHAGPGLHAASDLNARYTMGWRDPGVEG